MFFCVGSDLKLLLIRLVMWGSEMMDQVFLGLNETTVQLSDVRRLQPVTKLKAQC